MTTWLITGGAGYIGGHVIRDLRESGRSVVVFDDFSSGLHSRVPSDVPIVEGSVLDESALKKTLKDFTVDGVIHLAAKKAAGESVDIPNLYYRENVGGVLALCSAMQAMGVGRLVYSSSAAVYGTPAGNPVTESAALMPESPYGETKVIGEWLARDNGIAWGLSWVALRYFNVAGAGADDLGDTSVNNLIPMVFAALDRNERPRIFGDDYPTPDGTCIRDYIHVSDLSHAHVAAASRCEGASRAEVFNVGRGQGSSVREVMDVISEVIGRDVHAEVVARRPGDPPATWASTESIAEALGWTASRDLRDMVASAWSAWCANRI